MYVLCKVVAFQIPSIWDPYGQKSLELMQMASASTSSSTFRCLHSSECFPVWLRSHPNDLDICIPALLLWVMSKFEVHARKASYNMQRSERSGCVFVPISAWVVSHQPFALCTLILSFLETRKWWTTFVKWHGILHWISFFSFLKSLMLKLLKQNIQICCALQVLAYLSRVSRGDCDAL